jgi:hypothetical protein
VNVNDYGPKNFPSLTDEELALLRAAPSEVSGFATIDERGEEGMWRLLNTIDARDSALNHERVISADLRENLKASQGHHAAADEEIARLRAAVLDEIEGMEEQAAVDEGHGGTCNECAARALRAHAGFMRGALLDGAK